MNTTNLHDNLYWLFLQASFKSKQGLMKLAEQYDLTIVQLYVLCLMEPGKPLKMNEIAFKLACDPSNVTGIIDRLLVLHAIERQENPQDRRAKLISLTASGIKLREEVIAGIMAARPQSFDNLNTEQKRQLRELLGILLKPAE